MAEKTKTTRTRTIHKCSREADIAVMMSSITRLNNDFYNNGEHGVIYQMPVLIEKLNSAIIKIDVFEKTVKAIQLAQVQSEAADRAIKKRNVIDRENLELELSKKAQRRQIITTILTVISTTGALIGLLFGMGILS